MNTDVLIAALKDAEAREKSGMPAMGILDSSSNRPWGQRQFNSVGLRTWTEYKENLSKLKETDLTASTTTMYGCTGLFGLCGPDEIIGLSMADDKLIEWMGWRESTVCEQFVKLITYMDAAGTADGSPQSLAGAACDTPPNSEKGTAEIFLGDKGLYRVCGEPIDLTKTGERKCDKQPTYTLPIPGSPNGVRVDNDLDFEAIVAAEALKHGISRHLFTGDKDTTGEFDGLAQLVNDGYVDVKTGNAVPAFDSLIVDWASDTVDGAVNGHGSIIKKITDVVRRIRQRVNMAGKGNVAPGDLVLVMPTFLRDCVLDAWACYGLCDASQYNEIFRDNLAVREFRDKFTVGLYGDGFVTVDGIPVPIVAHDWMPIGQNGGNFTADIYVLTRRIGATPILYGQYHPMNLASDVASKFGAQQFRPLQGNRVIQWMKTDNLCMQTCLAIKPNVYLSAPWAQARITDVACNPQFDPISNDPQSAYFIQTKNVAEPIVQYWYSDAGWTHVNSGF